MTRHALIERPKRRALSTLSSIPCYIQTTQAMDEKQSASFLPRRLRAARPPLLSSPALTKAGFSKVRLNKMRLTPRFRAPAAAPAASEPRGAAPSATEPSKAVQDLVTDTLREVQAMLGTGPRFVRRTLDVWLPIEASVELRVAFGRHAGAWRLRRSAPVQLHVRWQDATTPTTFEWG